MHFFDVGVAELIKMGRRKLQPSGEWIAPDYSCLQGTMLGRQLFGI
jgi:hypothetical protein